MGQALFRPALIAMFWAVDAEAALASTGTPATEYRSSPAWAARSATTEASPRAMTKIRRCMGRPFGRADYTEPTGSAEAGYSRYPMTVDTSRPGLWTAARDPKQNQGFSFAINDQQNQQGLADL